MADYVMLMMGSESAGDWEIYLEKLIASGKFRGGSSLGHGVSMAKGQGDEASEVTGYMRFEADSIEEVRALLSGNPLYEAGGRVEILEEIPD
jgi:hypothetical protein